MILADIRLTLQPDAGAAFDAAIGPFVSQSRAASGNLDFQVLRAQGDARRVVLLERWTTLADFDAYLASAAFVAFRSGIGPLLAAPPDSTYYNASIAERTPVR